MIPSYYAPTIDLSGEIIWEPPVYVCKRPKAPEWYQPIAKHGPVPEWVIRNTQFSSTLLGALPMPTPRSTPTFPIPSSSLSIANATKALSIHLGGNIRRSFEPRIPLSSTPEPEPTGRIPVPTGLTRHAVTNLLHAPQLEIASFSRFCHLPPDLFEKTSIAGLSILSECLDSYHKDVSKSTSSGFSDAPHTAPSPFIPPPGQRLIFLRTNHGFDPATEAGWGSIISKVQRLTCSYKALEHRHRMSQLVSMTEGPVRELRIKYSLLPVDHPLSDGSIYRPIIELSELPRLQSLTLSICPRLFSPRYNPNFDPGLAKTIGLLDGPPCYLLETVRVELFFDLWGPKEDFLIPSPNVVSLWDKMDRVLASERYPSLQRFQLNIMVSLKAISDQFDSDRMKSCTTKLFDASFHRVKARGNITTDMIFPEEILAEIISNLGRHPPVPKDILDQELPTWNPLWRDEISRAALQSLCLTSQACRRITAPILFHNLEITGDALVMKRRILRLLHIFEINDSFARKTQSAMASCIRYVTIRPYAHPRPPSRLRKDFLNTYQDERFLAFLDYLSESKDITLRGFCLLAPAHTYQSRRWIDLSSSLRTSIRRLIRKDTLQVLAFSRISCLPNYIFNGSSIQGLSIISCQEASPQDLLINDAEIADAIALNELPPPNIQFLHTDHYFDITATPNWSNNKQDLQGVNSYITSRHQPAKSAKLLSTTHKTLKDLQMDILYMPSNPLEDGAFDFGQLQCLSSLTITLSDDTLEGHLRPDTLSSLLLVLDGRPCKSLQTLRLHLTTYDIGTDDFFGTSHMFSDCFNKVSDVLASTKYPSLKTFKLGMSITLESSNKSDNFDDIKERLQIHSKTHFNPCFQRLESAGIKVEIELSSHISD
ncbi:hypothetical protein CVT24_011140 [Panaeolus cyanescens]|uniref:Uncharacterized protein n=1 Tax=Panaeolus cyanescens TaxID=181874 RepID=A0A409YG74_9AGAR|nr:hypothetical protein CVT24_011140 [Panaeolus cyanescens]